jgi:hypothetical protein
MLQGKVDEDYINEGTRQGNKGIMHGKARKQSDFGARMTGVSSAQSSINMIPRTHCIELNYDYRESPGMSLDPLDPAAASSTARLVARITAWIRRYHRSLSCRELLILDANQALTIDGSEGMGSDSRIIQVIPTTTMTPANAQIILTSRTNADSSRLAGLVTGKEASVGLPDTGVPLRIIFQTMI